MGMVGYEKVLADKGFTSDKGLATELQADAENPDTGGGDVSANGDYVVAGAWTKGDVRAFVEQNTAPEDLGGGMTAVVTHPKVLVVEGPKGRCAVQLHDLDVLDDVLDAVS